MNYQHGDQSHAVEIAPLGDDHYRVTLDGQTHAITARQLPDGGWLLTLAGQQVRGYCVAQGSERYVAVDGQHITLSVADARSARRRAGGAAGDLNAQMPGLVREVLVSQGDLVEAGQTLLILEAMKMEIRVTAPEAGTVKTLLVTPGAVVERGQRLVELAD